MEKFHHHLHLVSLVVLWAMVACSGTAAQSESISIDPYACQGRDLPLVDFDSLKFSPDCHCVDSVQSGLSWNGLTIGESSREEVQNFFGYGGSRNSDYGSLRFVESNKEIYEWSEAEACFVDDTLSILYLELNRDPTMMRMNEVIEKHGMPDRITWGTDYDTRAFIWSDKGLLMFIRLSEIANGPAVLFPPIPTSELETSWLIASLPKEAIGSPPEDVEVGPYTVENPWEDILK